MIINIHTKHKFSIYSLLARINDNKIDKILEAQILILDRFLYFVQKNRKKNKSKSQKQYFKNALYIEGRKIETASHRFSRK
jgi:hypothetical protein